jgi:hypothetical protein
MEDKPSHRTDDFVLADILTILKRKSRLKRETTGEPFEY